MLYFVNVEHRLNESVRSLGLQRYFYKSKLNFNLYERYGGRDRRRKTESEQRM